MIGTLEARVFLPLLGLILAAVAGVPGSSPAHAEMIRVMSFNIRYDNPDDGENAWAHRRDWVGELIREHQIDVLGLQEVLKSQVDDLRQRLPEYGWYGVGRDDGHEAGEFAPIFFRSDRFELVDKGHFWLCERPDEPGRIDWEAACARITTWVALKERNTSKARGHKQYFFNTHFDHRSDEARDKSAILLRTRIAAINDGSVVLTGDFNCRSGSTPIKLLTAIAKGEDHAVLRDAYELGKDVHQGPLGTWNGFRAIQPEHRIDFVFVSRQWRVTVHQILDQQRNGRFPSDHLPVLAELSADD